MTISEIFQYLLKGIFIFIVLILLFAFIYPNFQSSGGPHYNCNSKFEAEANNIEAAISSYFAIPDRTEIPSIDDLVNSGDYTPIEDRDPKRSAKLVRDSEFSAVILSENINQIIIVLSAKDGRCPFDEGECPRIFKGEVYVKKVTGDEAWYESYDEFKIAEENVIKRKF